jgi:DNA-binding transcriptional ArsR family regulator
MLEPALIRYSTNEEYFEPIRSVKTFRQISNRGPASGREPSGGLLEPLGLALSRLGKTHRFDYTKNIEFKSGALVENKDAVTALAALAQESRLATFRLLVQAGPSGLAASKIAEALGMPPSSLSFHLKELSNANLIVPRQEGRFVIYAAQFEAMNALLGFLTENCCGGNPCSPLGSPACEPGASPCRS